MRQIFKFLLSIAAAIAVTTAGCIAFVVLLLTPLSDPVTLIIALLALLAIIFPVTAFYKKKFDELFDTTFPTEQNK